MSQSVIDIRNRLRAARPTRPDAQGARPTRQAEEPAQFAVEGYNAETDRHRVVVAAPLSEVAGARDDGVLNLSGRLVEAERANRNGAFWSQQDLEFGLPSVAFGPLNWLHEESRIIGALHNPRMVSAEQAAVSEPGVGAHIATDATVWGYIHRDEAAAIQRFVEQGRAWLSMECIADRIQCTGPAGCGKEIAYMDAMTRSGECCEHVKERASHRRFVNPVFRGAAVILPPVEPGWAKADLGAARKAEVYLEAAALHTGPMSDEDAAGLVSNVLRWANRR